MIAEFNNQYPFQVSLWIEGNGDPRSLFACGSWMEYARCRSRMRAEEVAFCLSLRHRGGVQVAELVCDTQGARFVECKVYAG